MWGCFTRLRGVGLAASVVVLAGCGGGEMKTAVVRGKVTYNGRPVPNGTITFVPEGGGPSATGQTGSDGTFALTTYKSDDGAVLGKHKVMIVAVQDTSNLLPEQRNLPAPVIPDKYLSTATSDLTATVEDKENRIDFDLKDDRPSKKK